MKTRVALFSIAVLGFALFLWPGVEWRGRLGYVASRVYAVTPQQAAQGQANHRDDAGFYLNRLGGHSFRLGTLLKIRGLRYMFDASFDPSDKPYVNVSARCIPAQRGHFSGRRVARPVCIRGSVARRR